MKKIFYLLAALCFLASAAFFVRARRGQADREAARVVRLGYFLGGRTNLFGRAFADGYFDREGVNVELNTRWLGGEPLKMPKDTAEVAALQGGGHFSKITGTEIVDLITRGELDGGLIGDASFISAAHAGKPIVAVALLGHDRKDEPNHGVVLRKGLVIRKPADFAGLRLITRSAGPGDLVFLKEFLRKEGVPEKSVTILDNVDAASVRTILAEGKADGGYLHLMSIERHVRKGEVYLYRPLNWVNPEISLALLVFRKDFLEANRGLVEKTVAGYMKRILYEQSLPDHRREKNKKGKGGKTALMEMDFPGMNLPVYEYPPKIRLELLREMEALMRSHGLLKGEADLEKYADLGVVETVLKSQAAATR